MKKIILLNLLILLCKSLFAQDTPPQPEIFKVVEQNPDFPGGNQAMYSYLNEELIYPKEALKNRIEGRVRVRFIVNEDGSIQKVTTAGKTLGFGLEEEAIRIVYSMPCWKPGSYNGKAVKTYFTIPIKFTLEKEIEK